MADVTAQTIPSPLSQRDKVPRKASMSRSKRLISLEAFLERYVSREDPFKYEWNNGLIEKKPRTMHRDQFFIFQNLLKHYILLPDFAQGGALICEVDMLVASVGRTRRADIARLSPEQMAVSREGGLSVCAFVIEVVSKNDQIVEMNEKLQEYFDNGVQVVWVVFPKLGKVEVHRSKREVMYCFDNDLCSAAPALPDLEITVSDLFL